MSVSELDKSLKLIIRLCQQERFTKDYNNLTKSLAIDNNSQLRSLNPFMDNDSLMRVGGRLKNSILTYNEKHPPILPKDQPHPTQLGESSR